MSGDYSTIILCSIIAVAVAIIMALVRNANHREFARARESLSLTDQPWVGRYRASDVALDRDRLHLRNIYDNEQDPYDSTSSDELDHAGERPNKFGHY
jgi:hypothetical protein